MTASNEELIEQFKDALRESDRPTAFEDEGAKEEENPLETDFFKAMNAFRAARNADDREAMAAAEERLRQVVRSELTGE